MSDGPPPILPPLPTPDQARSGCLTAILIGIGIVMLLPGLCSLIFMFGGLVNSAQDVWLVGIMMTVGVIGVATIWWAVSRRRR